MSFDGTWNCTVDTPMGKQNFVITLTVAGAQLAGKLSTPMGDSEIKDGAVNGDTGTWKASLTKPMPVTLEFSTTVSGDSMEGSVKLGMFGKAALKGQRA